jgi:hypothetical protein
MKRDRLSEHHMPEVNTSTSWMDASAGHFTPGMCCSEQTQFCNERHQRRPGTRTLETNPHTLALDSHGGWYGHLHAWKFGFTGGDDDHGCFSCLDACRRSIHCGEDLRQLATLSPEDGAERAASGHDQHRCSRRQYWQAIFQTSHAGKEMRAQPIVLEHDQARHGCA